MFVAINAIEVPAERADDFGERFANRAGMVEHSPGFVRFELLRPADGGTRWLVATHWESEKAFEDWMSSRAFGEGHAQHRDRGPAGTGSELWRFEVAQQVG
jgi:heme-degrading monooxygenase HmoA